MAENSGCEKRIMDNDSIPVNSLIDLIENGIISSDEVLDMLNMNKRIQQVKILHPYEIHYTEKSGWFTVVDDDTQPTGKRKIRKCSEENLWKALAEWYIDKPKSVTLAELIDMWLAWKNTPDHEDNVKRLKQSLKAYYTDEPLSQELLSKPVNSITSLQLREWAESLLRKHYPVDVKKFSRMFTILNQCMEFACDEDRAIIQENVWEKAKKKINKDLLTKKRTPEDYTQVFTDEERLLIREMVEKDLEKYKKQPTSAGLQILFLLETGVRIGEATALKWSDIDGRFLTIQRQANNDTVKEWTKSSAGYRTIPLTEEAQRILDRVKEYNQEHGYTAEWIFQSDDETHDHRLGYQSADKKLRKLCHRLNISAKSPHKLRKTCISVLVDKNVNLRTVQRFAGHADIDTTIQYYYYARTSREQQAEEIDKALRI